MCAVEYIIDEFGNLTTKSGISLESQFSVANSTNNKENQKNEVEKMNKVFEALERLAMPDELHKQECEKLGISLTEDYEIVKQALTEIKSIKEAKPSEAMKCVERLHQTIEMAENFYDAPYEDKDLFAAVQRDVDTINQSLLKVQEQEKELSKYKKGR